MNKSDALYGFHASNGHSIEECSEFKDFLQDLMNRHLLQISHQKKGEEVFVRAYQNPNHW